MADYSVEIDVSGPLFDERAQVAMDEFVRNLEDDVAEEGVRVVRGLLATVLRHPTGAYERSVTWERRTSFSTVIGDRLIYSWWLEGVGSRNAPVTRFAGYHTLRRATTVLQGNVQDIAARSALPRLLAELEG